MSLWRLAKAYDSLSRMNRPCILLIAAGASPLLGQAADFAASDRLAIDQLFDRYVHAFSTKDYGALKECLQAPFVGFRGPLNVLQTLDDVINTYRNELNALDESNYDHSQFTASRIIALSADRATSSMHRNGLSHDLLGAARECIGMGDELAHLPEFSI